MKRMKKIFALLLAVVMMMGLGVTASAATITINNPAEGETYTAYKLFDVSNSGTAYSYSTTNQELVEALSDEEAALGITFTKAASENVWYVSGLEDPTDAEALAKYIHDNWDTVFNGLLGEGIAAEEVDGKMQIDTGDDKGYYFVTSTLGSLCALDTTTDEAFVNEKNFVPSIVKTVQEDSNGEYGESATVDAVDVVNYRLEVTVGTGVDGDYTITDKLPAGITYNEGSSTTMIAGWNLGTDYVVTSPSSENDNTLTIVLKADKLATLDADEKIIINYSANALGLKVGENYTNTVTLSYKAQNITDDATVITYGIDGSAEGSKFTKVGSGDNQPLKGVKFVLQNDTTKKYATFDDNHYLTGWVDSQEEATPLETDINGHIYAYGLDADTYILTETYTLPGYNLLNDTITAVIDKDGKVTYQYTNTDTDGSANEITVINKTGTELPSTGGMGTTLIYIAGAVLVIGAGVLLVVRRRMNAER